MKIERQSFWKVALGVFTLWAMLAIAAEAQTFKNLASFTGSSGDGSQPWSMVQGLNGNLYGTTQDYSGFGTAFELTLGGKLSLLLNFDETNGNEPASGMVLGTTGDFYGTTDGGGTGSVGTVYELTPGGKFTSLYSFCSKASCADGEYPLAALVQATNGNFYGTTQAGGANGLGTVFEITRTGTLTTLYSFCAQTNCTDGEQPWSAVVQGTNGNFYGTTQYGGGNGPGDGGGTVYEITPAGKLTTLYKFCAQTDCTDGANPIAGLLQASDGNFYGTTTAGGAKGSGTFFKITPGGTLTTLYNFCSETSCTDGAIPEGTLIQATDGNLYGTTYGGGTNLDGTVFEFTTSGTLTTLHSFDCSDGANPDSPLVQATSGTIYGTTRGNIDCGDGTAFAVANGMSPFVETLPTSGKVGANIIILGNNLTGTTAVTFNGMAATFTVLSATDLKVTVPTGATTGTVEVITPKATLSSNVPFTVK
jgi:uncharacterized repeat protein (TIGR03803 family)